MREATEEVQYTKESKILAIVPKVPALLSILGSSYIVYNVLCIQRKKKKNERNKLYHQLMLALSISDILASHIYFLGTFLIPKGSGGPYGPVYWAFGNDGTCSYSGFFNQIAVASPIYNTMLSLYFLLKIRYGWKTVRLNKIGPFLHAFPISFALGTSFFALFRQPNTLYGNVFWTCWINPDPPQPDFRWFQWGFLFAPVWICVIFQTVAMALLYRSVRNVEQSAKKVEVSKEFTSSADKTEAMSIDFSSSHDRSREGCISRDENDEVDDDDDDSDDCDKDYSEADIEEQNLDGAAILALRAKKQRHSRMIAIQGILYVVAFYIVWLFPTIQRILEVAGAQAKFYLQALDTSLLPLQGLFNVIIYFRPKYVHYRRKYPDLPCRSILKMVHNGANEEVIVEKFTTRINEQLSRLRQGDADGSTTGGSSRSMLPKKDRGVVVDENQLPPIQEVEWSSSSSSAANVTSKSPVDINMKSASSSNTMVMGANNQAMIKSSIQEEEGAKQQEQQQRGPNEEAEKGNHSEPLSALMNWLQEEAQHQQEYREQFQISNPNYPETTSQFQMDDISLFETNDDGWT